MSQNSESYEKIKKFCGEHEVPVREVEHLAEGRCEEVSTLRGNRLSQAAKALVAMIKIGKKERRYILAVVPATKRVNFEAIRKLVGGERAMPAPADRAEALTGCPMGAVPPFSSNPDLSLVVDPTMLDEDEIVFNAGRLDRSFFVPSKAFFAAAGGRVASIAD